MPKTNNTRDIVEFYPDARYNNEIPTPESIIGHRVGDCFTHHSDLLNYYRRLAEVSPKLRLQVYGRSYERRPLLQLIISSEKNLARLDQIRAANQRLGDPRRLSEVEMTELIKDLPATVWFSYNVHGDEAACSEAALQVVYHLLADDSAETAQLLNDLVIIIDPLVNPDGRERYVSFYEQQHGAKPRPDINAAEHTQSWPGGRLNHYLFDLNRDWAWMTQRESQARVRAFCAWQPQLHVDFHEMQEDATYFFPPAARPVNANIPALIQEWLTIYGQGNGQMFTRFGLSFYTGEDFDLYHPSYGDSWPSLNGAVGMTYEQAGSGRAGLSVRLPQRQTIVTLRERAWHHFLTSIASLQTTSKRRQDRLRDYYRFRAQAISAGHNENMKMLVLLPGRDPARLAHLITLLINQGIEVIETNETFKSEQAHSYLGSNEKTREFPAGAYLIDLAQPAGFLARGLLEPEAVLQDLYFYDVTGWSLPLAYGVESYWLADRPQIIGKPLQTAPIVCGHIIGDQAQYGYVFSYESNGAAHTLSRLLQEDFEAFIALKPLTINGRAFPHGAIILPVNNNGPELHERIHALAQANGHDVIAAGSARSESGIDLGSYRVRAIRKPKILVVMGRGVNATNYGSIWHLCDERYEIDFTPVTIDQLAGLDLREYNTLILPDDGRAGRNYAAMIGKPVIDKLKEWVNEGGCLIGIKGGAIFTTVKESGLTSVSYRFLSEEQERDRLEREKAADKTSDKTVDKEKASANADVDEEQRLANLLRPYAEKEQRRMYQIVPGTLMQIRLDNTHPLGVGYDQNIVVLNLNSPVFSLTSKGDNVAYYPKENFKLSGYISSENTVKLAHSGFLIKERIGKGSIILYADDPIFRSFWEGTIRLFLNSILFGSVIDPFADR